MTPPPRRHKRFTVKDNIAIIETWRQIQIFMLANEKFLLDEAGKPLPNPLLAELYLAGTKAAKRLQGI